ncbi:MAG: hypothetical protein IIY94_09120 [Oscillospiraceae bacterium]|nr:hypothetical protein [Oscillospiraceae bacterium]
MIGTIFNLACYVIFGILILLAGFGLFVNLWIVFFSDEGMWQRFKSAVSVILMIYVFIKVQGAIHSIWISLFAAAFMSLLGIGCDDSKTASTPPPQPGPTLTDVIVDVALDYYVAKDAARNVYEKEYKNR